MGNRKKEKDIRSKRERMQDDDAPYYFSWNIKGGGGRSKRGRVKGAGWGSSYFAAFFLFISTPPHPSLISTSLTLEINSASGFCSFHSPPHKKLSSLSLSLFIPSLSFMQHVCVCINVYECLVVQNKEQLYVYVPFISFGGTHGNNALT